MASDWNERRCFDCSDDFRGQKRFAVLKQLRDFPDESELEPWEVGMVRAMCFGPVFVCADCAGWYGDEAIDVTEDASAADEPLAVQRDEVVIETAALPHQEQE